MAKAYSDDLRRKLIEAYQQGEGSLEVLARRFHVSVGWARKVSATYRRSGSWARPPSGPRGPRSKFTGEIRQQVGEWMAEQPDLTLHELQSRLHEELRLRASIGRLWSLLREMGLRLKKTLYAANRQRRTEWRQQARRIDPERLIFLDESSVATEMTRRYGRARRGRRVREGVPARRWRTLSVLGAIRRSGWVGAMTIEAPTDGEIFLAYLH